jgi:U3 small nucleolar RNA-associated protein 11
VNVADGAQEGVHVKERGNVAMPVDMVKVLKTQDENYVRTMRTAGRKVHSLAFQHAIILIPI